VLKGVSLVDSRHGNEPCAVPALTALAKHSSSNDVTSAVLNVPINFRSYQIVRLLIDGVWLTFSLDRGLLEWDLQPLAEQLDMLFGDVVPDTILISGELLMEILSLVMNDFENFPIRQRDEFCDTTEMSTVSADP
jgi:hypothetical protein